MYIKNDQLLIRNATSEDASILCKWWRDGRVMEHAGLPKGLEINDEDIKKSLLKDTDESHRRLIIEINDIPAGEMNYQNIGNDTAQIGIKICDFKIQNMGYGTVLLKMLINSLFEDYGYSKIILDTNLNNKRAQHVYEKIGFIKVNVRYDCWKNQMGELQSAVDYELCRKNYII